WCSSFMSAMCEQRSASCRTAARAAACSSRKAPCSTSCAIAYIGEVLYKGEICPGPQPPLIDRELFEAVQRRLTEQRSHHVTTRTKNDAPLKGILFDAAGDPMVPTHATKQGVRYRYYVSQPYLRGLAKPIGAIVRVPAPDIEAVVSKAL